MLIVFETTASGCSVPLWRMKQTQGHLETNQLQIDKQSKQTDYVSV